jgi:hypothetical protein
MKRAKLAVVGMAAAVIMTGCGSGNTTVSQIEPTTVKITPDSVVFDWQKLYESKLNEFRQSADYKDGLGGSMFDICDITGDGSPELIISPSSDAETACQMYTLSGGSVSSLGENGANGVMLYIPSKNTISFAYIGKSFEIREFKLLEDGEFITKDKFYNNRNGIASGGKLTYEVNNEEVTGVEYDKAVAAYTSLPSLELGRKYSFGAQSQKYALYCSESWGPVLNDAQKEQYKKILADCLQSADTGAAFDIVDINGDNEPELVYSEGSFDTAECNIYMFNGDTAVEAGSCMTARGTINCDVEKKVYFASDSTETDAYALGSSEKTAGYSKTDNIIECGRRYVLTEESIQKAFC